MPPSDCLGRDCQAERDRTDSVRRRSPGGGGRARRARAGLSRARGFSARRRRRLRSAVIALTALEAGCASTDVSLTVRRARAAADHRAVGRRVDCGTTRHRGAVAARRSRDSMARLTKLWPPGPFTLASAATRAIHAALTRTPRTVSAFVSVTRDGRHAGPRRHAAGDAHPTRHRPCRRPTFCRRAIRFASKPRCTPRKPHAPPRCPRDSRRRAGHAGRVSDRGRRRASFARRGGRRRDSTSRASAISRTSSCCRPTSSRAAATARPVSSARRTTSRGSSERPALEPGGDAGSYFQTFAIAAAPASPIRKPRSRSPRDRARRRSSSASSFIRCRSSPTASRICPPTARPLRRRRRDGLCRVRHLRSGPRLRRLRWGSTSRGKAVVVFTHEPQEHDPGSIFEGDALTRAQRPRAEGRTGRASRRPRARARRGPVTCARSRDGARLADDPQIDALGIPVVRVERERLDRDARGDRLHQNREATSIASLKPQSRALAAATLSYTEAFVRTARASATWSASCAERIRRVATEAIVIGAHYDHLGLGGRFSLSAARARRRFTTAPTTTRRARQRSSRWRAWPAVNRRRFRRTVVFAAFAGEEIGLLGSTHYVAHAANPARRNDGDDQPRHDRPRERARHDRRRRSQRARSGRSSTSSARSRPYGSTASQQGYQEGASDDASFLRHGVPGARVLHGFPRRLSSAERRLAAGGRGRRGRDRDLALELSSV